MIERNKFRFKYINMMMMMIINNINNIRSESFPYGLPSLLPPGFKFPEMFTKLCL